MTINAARPEKSIMLSAEMVRAVLNNSKTMHRQVIKTQPPVNSIYHGQVTSSTDTKKEGYIGWGPNENEVSIYSKCTYQVGDIIWVQEPWAVHDLMLKPRKLNPDKQEWFYSGEFKDTMVEKVVYAADYPKESFKGAWRRSVHLPRSAARLLLKIKSVRVERLQDITEEDAIREGHKTLRCSCNKQAYACTDCMNTGLLEPAELSFLQTWDSTNTKHGNGWATNPWVWVLEF